MVLFQAVIALPFVAWGDTSIRRYLFYSKFTLEGRGGVGGADKVYDYMSSNHYATIFWKFIPEEIYETKELLADRLKIALVSLNIYHFFIRKMCLQQCISNIWHPFKGSFDFRKTIEILLIGYFTGIVLMPGAHF